MNAFDPTNLVNFNAKLAELDRTLNPVTIKKIFVGNGVRNGLFNIIDPAKKILLVMDDTQMHVNGNDLKKEIEDGFILRNIGFEKIIFRNKDSEDGMVHADWENVTLLKEKLDKNILIVSIGSGTITDISKHAVHLFCEETGVKIPFIVVQTANTVTAFTSNIAVLLKDGVKRTYPSTYPDYVISDTEVLKEAPFQLTQAGFGDLLARYVSYADWYLGYKCKNLDKYTEVPKILLDETLEYLFKNADKIKAGDDYAYTILTKALLNAGISMSIVGMSTPISGFEHVISHVLDMTCGINEEQPMLHGIQVGIATLFVAYAYEIMLKEKNIAEILTFPEWSKIEEKIKKEFTAKGFSKESVLEMIGDYKIKYDKWMEFEKDIRDFFKLWDSEKKIIRGLIKSGDEIKSALKNIGIKILIPKEMEFAFASAHFIRRRFTLADLFFFLNKLNPGLYKSIADQVSAE
jgi:glycerol-1-phosphate dehydrogenase [NAD(P)+]